MTIKLVKLSTNKIYEENVNEMFLYPQISVEKIEFK